MDSEGNIVINVQVTAEDFRRVLFRQSRKILVLSLPLIGIFGLSFFLISIWIFLSPGGASKRIPALLIFILPLLFVSILPAMILFNIWKQSKYLGRVAEPTEVIFRADSVKLIAQSSFVETLYSRYEKVVETRTDFIFYPQKQALIPFAKRFFTSDDDIRELRIRLVSNLAEKAEVLER